ncbi:MAG: hypothetical protein ACK5L2_05150, partial [Planctomyces sp.]
MTRLPHRCGPNRATPDNRPPLNPQPDKDQTIRLLTTEVQQKKRSNLKIVRLLTAVQLDVPAAYARLSRSNEKNQAPEKDSAMLVSRRHFL